MVHRRVFLVAGALALALIAGSPPRVVGDGGEYIAQALNFASLDGPSIGRRAIPVLQQQIGAFDPVLAEWDIEKASVPSDDRRRDFLHFWFYALLAAPAMRVAEALGLPLTYPFALVNVVLLGLALIVVLPRAGLAAAVLLFAGPLMWWIDKAHTEIFTVSLLAIAFALMREKPWWSLVAVGAASTQNPPIAIVFGIITVGAISHDRAIWRDRRFQIGAAAGIALLALHPVYSLWRHGTPSLLLYATRPGMPDWAELSAVVLDPTLGLVGSFPVFLVIVAAATLLLLVREPRALLRPDIAAAIVTAALFLYSFARTTNMHHGATPGMSRYALWLIPLAVPIFIWARDGGRRIWRGTIAGAAACSAALSAFAFHPAVPQNSREPSWLANYLWTTHPGWNNPLPEVFMETVLRREDPWVPVFTSGCEKVLLAGDGKNLGDWPIPCYPAEPPDRCRRRDMFCYANLDGRRYTFVTPPGRRTDQLLTRETALWPRDVEPYVRGLYEQWRWWELTADSGRVPMIRAAHGMDMAMIGGDDRAILVLREIEPGAAVRVRPPGPTRGRIIDPVTQAVVQELSFTESADGAWMIEIPPTANLLLLTLEPEGRP